VSGPYPPLGGMSAIPIIGALVRYSFYLIGSIVFAMVAVLLLSHPSPKVTPPVTPPAEDKPGFRLNDVDLAHMPQTNYVFNFQPSGRIEARQYGHLTDRGSDFTIALFMMPGLAMAPGDINQEMARLRRFNILRGAGLYGNEKFYDLHTRFGEIRATEMRADVDGQRKLCLGFVSRFDTPFAHLSGWYCTASGTRPGAVELACMLDQFVLSSPLASPLADAFFRTRAALAPTCSADPVSQTTDTRPFIPRRPAW
jgi:hypothetical protein